MRSVAVVVFVAAIAVLATYLAQRPTIARGSVLAATLLEANGSALRGVTCDDEVPITTGITTFECEVVFASGIVKQVPFVMDRAGMINAAPAPAE